MTTSDFQACGSTGDECYPAINAILMGPEDHGKKARMIEQKTAIAPVIGWRSWQLQWHNDGSEMKPVLYSSNATVWPSDGWLRAECKNGDGHAAPQPYCSCGLYARKDRKTVEQENFYRTVSVFGEVELGGLVIEADGGYVASHASPKKLYVYDGKCPGDTERGDRLSLSSSATLLHTFVTFSTGGVPECLCIQPDFIELAKMASDNYGIELEVVERECPCGQHRHGKDKDDEHRGTEAVYTDPSTGAWTLGTVTAVDSGGIATVSLGGAGSTQGASPSAPDGKSWLRKLF